MPTIITINEGSLATSAALGTGRSGSHALLTYLDAYDIGVSFLQGHGQEASSEVVRRAIQEAHLDVINAYDWPSKEGAGRIHLHAAQSTGTVAYNATTRYLTLSGATWPDWVLDGSVVLDSTICEVETYVDATRIILHESLNPGVTLAAGTTYSLVCHWYPLPADFVNFTGPMGRNTWAYGQQVSMAEISAFQKNYGSTGAVRYYAIGERPNAPGEKAIFPWPFAPDDEPLDFTYQRRPRELQYSGRDAADCVGTITVVAGSNAIVGSSTTFESGMAGAVLLVGRDGTNAPTGRYGLNRFSEQLRIHSVTAATAAAATTNAVTSRAAVKYVVTDPIDIETCAQNAFLRYVEMHLAMARGIDTNSQHGGFNGQYVAVAEKALREAMAASYPVRYDPAQGYGGYGPVGTVDRSPYGG